MPAAATTLPIAWTRKTMSHAQPLHPNLCTAQAKGNRSLSPSPSGSPGPSPYPPSTPSLSPSASSDDDSDSNSDSNSTPTKRKKAATTSPAIGIQLRTTLATLPESRLRELVVRLADTRPAFQDALAQELLQASPGTPTPTLNERVHVQRAIPGVGDATRSPRGPSLRKRRPRRATITNADTTKSTPKSSSTSPPRGRQRSSSQGTKHYYHPGRLEEDVFEFPWSCSPSSPTAAAAVTLSGLGEGLSSFPVLKTIRMWSCCDGDVESAGCCYRVGPIIASATSSKADIREDRASGQKLTATTGRRAGLAPGANRTGEAYAHVCDDWSCDDE